MNHGRPVTPAGPDALPWRVVAATLTLVATVCLIVWLNQPTEVDSSSGPVRAVASGPTKATTVPLTTSESPSPTGRLDASAVAPPVHLSIPVIGVSTPLARLGLQPDKTVEVPTDPALAGWFELGTAPGGLGSSVIVGHVDSTSGPAVFYRLKELQPGQRLTVSRANGSDVDFEVIDVATYPNEAFPAEKVYAGQGGRLLNLVTCGGAYDSTKGGYQSNVVVFTRMVGSGQQPG